MLSTVSSLYALLGRSLTIIDVDESEWESKLKMNKKVESATDSSDRAEGRRTKDRGGMGIGMAIMGDQHFHSVVQAYAKLISSCRCHDRMTCFSLVRVTLEPLSDHQDSA